MSKRKTRSAATMQPWWSDRTVWLSVAIIVVLTVLTYQPVFDTDKQFVNWDDDDYITEQPLVQSTSSKNVARMFDTQTHVSANYHPLTMLSLAMDVDRGGMAIRPIMQTNLALHVMNAVMVFALMYLLLQRNIVVAFTVALMFATHPMHVESVAWAAARKDVLYTFWFLASALAYMGYVGARRWSVYALSLGLFALSCLSKPMAVTLPIVLLAVDMYTGRTVRGWGSVILDKLPFLGLSVYFGMLTFSIQSAGAAGLVDTTTYGLFDRLVFAGYGVLQYAFKLVLPVDLSAFYPYPSELQPGNVPVVMYAGATTVFIVLVGVILAWRRWFTPTWNTVIFGVAFYLITASLVLQVISVGGAAMADRYTYVPYVGLFVVLGVAIQRATQTARSTLVPLVLVTALGCVMAWLSYDRIGVWKNSDSLWTNVIEQFPYEFTSVNGREVLTKRGALYAYSNRGIHYIKTGQYNKAIADLGVLSRAGVTHPDSYRAYGVVLQMQSRHTEAVQAFTTAMQQGDRDYQIYRARGASYALGGNPAMAIPDYEQALRLQPGDQLTLTALAEAKTLLAQQQPTVGSK